MTKIAIYGAGGFGKEIAALIGKINEKSPEWHFIGFFDDGIAPHTSISHFGKVLGGIEQVNHWPEPLNLVFAIGNPVTLHHLVQKIVNPLIAFPNLFHPEVYFADPQSFKCGKGNVAVRGVSFSVDVQIGDFNQFNSFSALAHDVKIGSYNVFMPLSRISGEVTMGNENFFGIGSVVLQTVKIGDRIRLGAGSYLMRKPQNGKLYLGNPAKLTHLE